jgi:hypothetical protein
VEVDEADGIDADDNSTDDIGSQTAERQHLDADGADKHEIVSEVEQHPESHLNTDKAKARTTPQVIPQSQLRFFGLSSEPLVGDGAPEAASMVGSRPPDTRRWMPRRLCLRMGW